MKNLTLFLLTLTLLFCLNESVFAAATAGGGLPWDTWFTKVTDSITGPFAYALAIMGLVGAGATLIWGQEINAFLRTLIYVICALAFIVGAKAMLTTITGTGAEIPVLNEPLVNKVRK